jgi:FAD:protein FMN transferase
VAAPLHGAATWRAIGTFVELVVADVNQLDDAREIAVDLIAELDRTCSRFRDDSELSRANQAAGTWVPASPVLLDAVRVAVIAAQATDGVVDPTLGHSLIALGYDRDLADVQATTPASPLNPPGPRQADPRQVATSPAALPSAIPARRGAWSEIEITDGAIRLPFDVSLDLGATAKAYGSDCIAMALAARGIQGLISLGGDVSIARPEGAAEYWWRIAVCERPNTPGEQTLLMTSGGIATSSTTHRRWSHDRTTVHHLLDPSTGRPVEQTWRTVTVRAATCVAANTATTASLVMGDAAVPWLERNGLAARLVDQQGDVYEVAGWPGDPSDTRIDLSETMPTADS